MFESSTRKLIKDVVTLPVTSDLTFIYRLASDGALYAWNSANAAYEKLNNTSAPISPYTSTVQHEVKLAENISIAQAVYVSGADGTNMLVSKASNASELTSSKTLGLLLLGGVTNNKRFVITEGLFAGINTSTATLGDPVWLGVNGNLIYGYTNKPHAPAHLVFLGVVTRVNLNNGEIFVKVQNGFELEELHNVAIDTPNGKQSVYFNPTTMLWENGWNWFQYASGFTAGDIPTVLSDDGTTKILEYHYSFGTRYRKITASIDGFYTDAACTNLIITKTI
jgi:hypothetical protein